MSHDQSPIERAIMEGMLPLTDAIAVHARFLGIITGLLIEKGLLTPDEINERIEIFMRDATEQQRQLMAVAQRAINPNPH